VANILAVMVLLLDIKCFVQSIRYARQKTLQIRLRNKKYICYFACWNCWFKRVSPS